MHFTFTTNTESVSIVVQACPSCDGTADILIVVDSSGSIGEDNFETMRKFITKIASSFLIGEEKHQVCTQFQFLLFGEQLSVVV